MPGARTSQIRVVLVEDHAVVRSGLRLLIESGPGFAVVGEADNRDGAVAVVTREQPDVILLDLDLDGQSSLEFFPELASAAAGARVLVLTGVVNPEMHRRAVLLGCAGVVLKRQASEVLFSAIETVHHGEVWLDQATMAGVLRALSSAKKTEGEDASRIAALTKREREVILLIGEGLRNRQVGERLFISETTVRHHLTSVYSKLGVSNRLDLVVYAYRHDLSKPPEFSRPAQ
jgi:two-component system nitrate/nitrite response regulator NarL